MGILTKLLLTSILVPLLAVGMADAQMFRDWGVTTGDGGEVLVAGTINESGQAFGQGCWLSDESCFWILGLDVSCVKGRKHSVLVNSDAGTKALELFCLEGVATGGGRYRYAFTKFDEVDELVKQGSGLVGFALALKSSQFQVVRFSLDGAVAAVEAMRTTSAQRAGKSPTIRGTRDKRL